MPNSLSAKRCQKRKIAPADQLKVIDATRFTRTGRLWQPPVNGWRRVPLTEQPYLSQTCEHSNHFSKYPHAFIIFFLFFFFRRGEPLACFSPGNWIPLIFGASFGVG